MLSLWIKRLRLCLDRNERGERLEVILPWSTDTPSETSAPFGILLKLKTVIHQNMFMVRREKSLCCVRNRKVKLYCARKSSLQQRNGPTYCRIWDSIRIHFKASKCSFFIILKDLIFKELYCFIPLQNDKRKHMLYSFQRELICVLLKCVTILKIQLVSTPWGYIWWWRLPSIYSFRLFMSKAILGYGHLFMLTRMLIYSGVCKLRFKLRSQVNFACKYLQSVT
jgi:hypothetical protein